MERPIRRNMKILSLDISGSGTGWAIANDHTLSDDYGKYVSNVSKRRGERLDLFYKWLTRLLRKHRPDTILIEKPYLGRNSNVLVSLSKFVAIAELAVFSVLKKNIEDHWFIDPRTIKKTLNVGKPSSKLSPKEKHDANKKIMVKRINSLYGLKLKYMAGKSKQHCDDDIADAIAIIHAYWILVEEGKI
jgi:Holliday junction resolvasome RuvABC endonuclease subunit